MCTKCNIKSSTVVGAVVRNVRRCNQRSSNDRGAGLAINESLLYVTKIASRGEGVYGYVINPITHKLEKTYGFI